MNLVRDRRHWVPSVYRVMIYLVEHKDSSQTILNINWPLKYIGR
jgi:hypothetical protein